MIQFTKILKTYLLKDQFPESEHYKSQYTIHHKFSYFTSEKKNFSLMFRNSLNAFDFLIYIH